MFGCPTEVGKVLLAIQAGASLRFAVIRGSG